MNKSIWRMAAGAGYLYHAVRDNTPVAICGFRPRHGWAPVMHGYDAAPTPGINGMHCDRCKMLEKA